MRQLPSYLLVISVLLAAAVAVIDILNVVDDCLTAVSGDPRETYEYYQFSLSIYLCFAATYSILIRETFC